MTSILKYLQDLSGNNNREWFHKNKSAYKKSLELYSDMVSQIISGIQLFDSNLLNLHPGDAIFRIYRDIRFSNDKTPYKTHFGAYLAKGGRKSPDAAYYFHVEPGGSFMAAGVYMPDKDRLKAIRQEILYKPEEYMDIVNSNIKMGYTQHEHGDKLKKPPKGFPDDFKYLDQLKFKHYLFAKDYTDADLLSDGFIDRVIADFKGLYPFVNYLNTAMDFMGNE